MRNSSGFLSEKSRIEATQFFLNTLFSNLYCLSKIDFMVMLQSPQCEWIFSEEQTREQMDHYIVLAPTNSPESASTAHSASASSPKNSDEFVAAKNSRQHQLMISH